MSTPAAGGADVFVCPPVLRTERLVLRQITEADGEGLFSIFCDDEVTEYLTPPDHKGSLAGTRHAGHRKDRVRTQASPLFTTRLNTDKAIKFG